MKITSTTAIALGLLTAAGCMHNQRQTDRPQGAAASEYGSATARVTEPPEAQQPLNHVERADKLIGEEVLTSDHLHTGKIEDFVVDQESGQILYAVVGIGGVLGVGETRVAVAPTLFTEATKGMVQVNVDKRKLTRAPQVPRDMEKGKADFVRNVYGYFGQKEPSTNAASSATASFNSARKISELIGMKVQNSADQDIGKVETIVLNVPAGREVYVVITPSSEMNLENNYFALPPTALKLSTDQKTLVTDVTREKLANGPHFAKDDWSELSNTAWAQKVHQYYGQPTPFQTGELQPTGRTTDKRSNYPKQ